MVGPIGRRGYATATTDSGHEANSGDLSWALGHPELVINFASLAHHLTAQVEKAIVTEYYGTAPEHSYFTGCSNGGREALSEAQRFREDYDGIVAGAPASYLAHDWPGEVWPAWVTRSHPQGMIRKLPALNHRIGGLGACTVRI